jgi:hypothetical protein
MEEITPIPHSYYTFFTHKNYFRVMEMGLSTLHNVDIPCVGVEMVLDISYVVG